MKRISDRDFFTAVSFILLSTLCFSIASAFWKYLTLFGNISLVIFVRFFFPFIFSYLAFFLKRFKIQVKSIKPYLLRSLFVVGGQYAFIYVLAHSNLLISSLLYSTSGLFVPILQSVFLRVSTSKRSLLSIIISFIGVWIAIGTVNGLTTSISLIGFSSGILTAAAQLIQHQCSKTDHFPSINLIMYGLCSLYAFPFMFWKKSFLGFLNLLHLHTFLIIIGFSLLGITNQYFKNTAFRYVNKASSLVPFLYTTLIFSGIIDYVWLSIVPKAHTILGIVILLLGTSIMAIRKR